MTEHPATEAVVPVGLVDGQVAELEVCRIDGEIAYPQAGGFYGGWVTREIIGPFKGDTGTAAW